MSAMKASVHKGVLHRLATLTTMSPDNADQSLDSLYAEYAEAMGVAGVAPKQYPKLREAKELWESETPSEREIRREQEKDHRSPCRQVYCEVGYSKFWSVPLHVKLKELQNKHGLKWLRLSMSYHVFPNLREMLGSDLREKLGCDVVSQNEVDRPCNCTEEHKIRRGKCIFGGKCLTKCSVYEATCLQCKKVYIGKLQPFLKERFRGHCNTVQAHCNEIPGAVGNQNMPRIVPAHTTLSSHMQRHMLLCMDVTQVQIETDHIHRQLRVDIGWSGDPIRVHRTFGTVRCKLCNMERWRILKSRSRKNCKLMNADIGIHRDCDCIRTKRFHVLKKQDQ